MRIAICFFGITRNLRQHTLNSIEEFLFASAAAADPGFRRFGHFNLVQRVSNPRSGEENVPINSEEFKLLKCDAVSCTDQESLDRRLNFSEIERFGDSWEDNFNSLRNLVRQLYSLNEVTRLLTESGERFDLVVYSRPDLRFTARVEMTLVRPRTLCTPWFARGGGLNDRFALGDFETMAHYGRRYSLMRQYCEETGRPLHAERFLFWCARKHRLRNRYLMNVAFHRVRADGRVARPDLGDEGKWKFRLGTPVRFLRSLVSVRWT